MRPQALELRRNVTKTVGCKYWLSLPSAGADRQGSLPLMLFLHGAGERGDDLDLVKKHWPLGAVGPGDEFPFILLAPQCPLERWWDHDVLIALLDEVVANHPVDTDRIYVTGLSMGGFGTWGLAIDYPDRFAAIAPICGGGFPYFAERIRHLPVWAFHGAKDTVIPLYESQRMVDKLRECGGNVRLTIYPEADHDAWTETYANPELYAWFLGHSRATG